MKSEPDYVLMNVQQCRSAEGWQPIRIRSSSDPDKTYTVFVNPWHDPDTYVCQCEGYTYRGYCRHQLEAHEELCSWRTVIDGKLVDDEQTSQQRLAKICPRCGGPTQWVTEVVDLAKEKSK